MSAHPTVIPMGDNPPRPTQLPDAFISSREARALARFHIPRYEELPTFPLYREQVITYIENHMAPLSTDPAEALITASMVNNYIKAGLITAPEKKRYQTEHIARLMAVCIMKQVLPIASVQKLFEIQMRSYEVGVAYNYLVTEVEHALEATFSTVDLQPDSATIPASRHRMSERFDRKSGPFRMITDGSQRADVLRKCRAASQWNLFEL